MSRTGRAQFAQMRKLLDIVSQDGVLDNGTVTYKCMARQLFWRRVAAQLNAVEGGTTKNSYKWCRMWSDWKAKTKKKANLLARRKRNKLPCNVELSDLELRLLKVINYSPENKLEDDPAKEDSSESADAHSREMVNEECITYDLTYNGEPEDNRVFEFREEYIEHPFCDVMLKEEKSILNVNDSSYTENDTVVENQMEPERVTFMLNVDETSHPENGTIAQNQTGTERVKFEEKNDKRKNNVAMEELKIKTTLKLEKQKLQQRNEELRLKALELKLKGDELRLKELEMNKINYLTNIEEEKLKCFREISSSLKEILERNKMGDRLQDML